MSFGWGHGLPEYFPRVEDTKTAQPQPHMFCAPARAGNAPSNAARSREEDDTMSDEPELARTLSSSSFGSIGGNVAGLDWGEFLLSTCDPTHVRLARRNGSWRRAFASPTSNLYQNEMTGETHVCDWNCNSWVERKDGIRVCAISGKSLNARDRRRTYSSESAASARKRKSPRPECDESDCCVDPSRPMKRRHNSPPHNY